MKKKDKKIKKDKTKLETLDKIIFAGFTLIILVFIFIALFAIDLFNMKTKVVDEVTKMLIENQQNTLEEFVGDDATRHYKELIKTEFLRLNKNELELSQKKSNLEERENTIILKEKDITKQKEEIDLIEKKINGEYENITELSDVIENMEAPNSADMLSEIEDLKLVRNVIFNIEEEKGALILENMEPKLAAKIILERYTPKEESILISQKKENEEDEEYQEYQENQEEQESQENQGSQESSQEIISGEGSSE